MSFVNLIPSFPLYLVIPGVMPPPPFLNALLPKILCISRQQRQKKTKKKTRNHVFFHTLPKIKRSQSIAEESPVVFDASDYCGAG